MDDWYAFTDETYGKYNVDMSCLGEAYEREQKEYFVLSAMWCELSGEAVIGEPVQVKALDMHTCTIADSLGVDNATFEFTAPETSVVSGFAGWFDTHFNGSEANPAPNKVVLSTHPKIGYTHWGQQVFFLENAIELQAGDVVSGECTTTPLAHLYFPMWC